MIGFFNNYTHPPISYSPPPPPLLVPFQHKNCRAGKVRGERGEQNRKKKRKGKNVEEN